MHELHHGLINAEVNLLKLTVLTDVSLKKLNRFQSFVKINFRYNISETDKEKKVSGTRCPW